MRLHSQYGPLLLMVLRMVMDMLLWLLFSAVPIVAFGAALNIVYKDKYKYNTVASEDGACNYNPDEAFETYGHSVIILIETMLSADGQVERVMSYFWSLLCCTTVTYCYILFHSCHSSNASVSRPTR